MIVSPLLRGYSILVIKFLMLEVRGKPLRVGLVVSSNGAF